MEQICGGMSVFPTAEKTMSVLVNLILPLCMRMGGGGNSRTGKYAIIRDKRTLMFVKTTTEVKSNT